MEGSGIFFEGRKIKEGGEELVVGEGCWEGDY